MSSIKEEINNNENKQQQNKVPSTLRPLLESFARETIRLQPTNLIKFGCCFFNLLEKHLKNNPNEINYLLIENKLAYNCFRNELQQMVYLIYFILIFKFNLINNCSSSSFYLNQQKYVNPLDLAATKIQAAFRGYLLRSHPEKFGLDAIKINGICQRMRRNSNERLELFDNRKDLKRHSIGGYSHSQQIKVSPEDRAAIKIQSEIRGYLTRKHLENEKKQNKNAATKIQAYIRGYLTRKHLEEKGVIITPPRSRTSTNARYEIENN